MNTETPIQQSTLSQTLKSFVIETLKKTFVLEDFPMLVEAINSNDLFQQHYGVIGIRKLLSIEENSLVQAVIDTGLLPKLIEFMKQDQNPHLQLETAWALSNLASGTSEQVKALVDCGGVTQFLRLLASSRPEMVEQAIWGVGNITGDSAPFRDLVLDQGGVQLLASALEKGGSHAMIKHGTWALSNCCRGKPLPDFEKTKHAFPIFCHIIQTQDNQEILSDAFWGLTHILEADTDQKLTLPMEILPILTKTLENNFFASILIPCLRIIGEVAIRDEAQMKVLLEYSGFIPSFFKLLEYKKKIIRKEGCWVLQNIATGPPEHIELILGDPVYLKIVITLLCKDLEEVKTEAAHALSNAVSFCNEEQVLRFFENGVLDAFIHTLDSDSESVEIILTALEGIEKMLSNGEKIMLKNKATENFFLVSLEQNGGIQKIEQLQTHPNNQVYESALKIITNNFAQED